MSGRVLGQARVLCLKLQRPLKAPFSRVKRQAKPEEPGQSDPLKAELLHPDGALEPPKTFRTADTSDAPWITEGRPLSALKPWNSNPQPGSDSVTEVPTSLEHSELRKPKEAPTIRCSSWQNPRNPSRGTELYPGCLLQSAEELSTKFADLSPKSLSLNP